MKNCFGPVTPSNNLRRFATGPVHCLRTDKSSSPSPLGILLLRRQPPALLLLQRRCFWGIGSRVVLENPGMMMMLSVLMMMMLLIMMMPMKTGDGSEKKSGYVDVWTQVQ
jgi:hypothetical protein